MRIPLLSIFITSPFEGIQEHAQKVKECGWAFHKAMECYVSDKCVKFEEFREEVVRLEKEADAIKRRIRGHLPIGTWMPVHKFQLFLYLREQDAVLDAVEDVLDWVSYRVEPGIPEALRKDFFLLIDSVIAPIEELSRMVGEARKYFKSYSEKHRKLVKEIIRTLRKQEHEADKLEDAIKRKLFNINVDPVTLYHMLRLAEIIGSVADHAENTGDMMRAMISR